MTIISLDFETYYSSEYSLSRKDITEIDYVLDPRFQFICCSVKLDAAPSECHWGEDEIRRRFSDIDWSKVAILAHNMRFDGAIAAWRLGVKPALYLDTLSMCRATTHSRIGKSSLKAVSEYLGLPPKGTEVEDARGKRKEDFTPEQAQNYMRYSMRDNDNCYDIFQILRRKFPKPELSIIDWTMRMFIEPQVKLNPTKLAVYHAQVQAERAACLNRVGFIDKSVFASTLKFKALLEDHGVEVPMKISKTTGQEIPAMAKQDVAFKELCADDTQPPMVQALLAARLSVKSTLDETRAAKFLALSLREWPTTIKIFQDDPELYEAALWHGLAPAAQTGLAPIPLRYCAAHTTRFGGDGGFNWQNLRRGSPMLDAVEVEPGYRIIHRDASQIEARMTAWMAECHKLLDAFREGRDIYSEFASRVYQVHVTKADTLRRFVGKTSILGLGYGMGAPRFKVTLFLGIGGVSVKIEDSEASRIVGLYRREFEEIPTLWNRAETMLWRMLTLGHGGDGGRPGPSTGDPASYKPLPAIEYTQDAIFLPSGLPVAYPGLKWAQGTNAQGAFVRQFTYDDAYGDTKHLFGGKVIENVSQALSRVIITETARRIYGETKRWPFLTTHDSLDYVVPEAQVEDWDRYLDHQFALTPSWAPGLPLASEGGWGPTLGAAGRKENV